jgi:hypothetical protein
MQSSFLIYLACKEPHIRLSSKHCIRTSHHQPPPPTFIAGPTSQFYRSRRPRLSNPSPKSISFAVKTMTTLPLPHRQAMHFIRDSAWCGAENCRKKLAQRARLPRAGDRAARNGEPRQAFADRPAESEKTSLEYSPGQNQFDQRREMNGNGVWDPVRSGPVLSETSSRRETVLLASGWVGCCLQDYKTLLHHHRLLKSQHQEGKPSTAHGQRFRDGG